MSNKKTIELEVVHEHSVSDRVAKINHLNACAMLSAAQSSAFMIMAGVELLALRDQVGRGGWEPLFAGSEKRIKGPNAKHVSHFNFTSRSAQIYMRLADAARKNIPQLRELPIGQIALSDMTAEQQETLMQAVHKRTDGESYRQLAWEWNLAKKPQGSGAKGGGPGGSKGKEPLTLAEQEEALRTHAREQWGLIDRAFYGYEDQFTALSRTEVEAQVGLLEIQLQARKKWLTENK